MDETWYIVGNLGVLPLGPSFVYITLFGAVKNSNLEFRSENKKHPAQNYIGMSVQLIEIY